MDNAIKILKINILSLIAIVILGISITAKLINKALEKAVVFFCVAIVIFVLAIFSFILKNPGGFFGGVLNVVAYFIFGLIFMGVIVLIGAIFFQVFAMILSIAVTLFTSAVTFLMMGLNIISEITNSWYVTIYDICRREQDMLVNNQQGNKLKFACIFWIFLKLLNFIIIKILSNFFKLSIVSSIGVVIYSVFSLHLVINKTFGLNLFSYLNLFPAIDRVFSIIYYIILVASAVVVLISLGIEWEELGRTMEASTQEKYDYKDVLNI